MHIHVHICIYIHVCMCLHIFIYVCVFIYRWIVYNCIYILHVCTYINMVKLNEEKHTCNYLNLFTYEQPSFCRSGLSFIALVFSLKKSELSQFFVVQVTGNYVFFSFFLSENNFICFYFKG